MNDLHKLMINPPTIRSAIEPRKARVKAGSSLGSARVFLDQAALDRIVTIRSAIERELGARLSTSMVIRLALHLAAGRLGAPDGLDRVAQRVAAAQSGR